jgi:hypothetical protein
MLKNDFANDLILRDASLLRMRSFKINKVPHPEEAASFDWRLASS